MRHVPDGDIYKRCLDCFSSNELISILRSLEWPESWASWTPDSFGERFGSRSPVTQALRQFRIGGAPYLHFFGPASEKREATLATWVCSALYRSLSVDIIDAAVLSARYFEGLRTLNLARWAHVFELGKELEPKVGVYFLRQVVEHSKRRRLPLCLFTDKPISEMNRHESLPDLYSYAKFKSFSLI